jgi:hypothetical protein
LSVFVKALRRPDLTVSIVETFISSKCRKTLYRLEDVVNSYVGDGNQTKEFTVADSDDEAIGLQNQLVQAYEEIECLRLELNDRRD